MPLKKPAKRLSKPPQQDGRKSSAPGARQVEPGAKTELRARPQPQVFEEGVRLLQAGDFGRAKVLFDEAAAGPNREMAHSARIHARMCEHRMARAAPELRSAEDHYNFAITLMNQRSLEQAEQHLTQAMAMSPDGDHFYYAMALCRGWQGDAEGARRNLQKAIELQPKNRVAARNDPDFLELSRHQPLARLLYPEGAPSA